MDIKEKQIKLINELYRSFDHFNEHFCKGSLIRPIITLQGDSNRSTYGWYGRKFWGDVKDESQSFDEINLTAETLHREPTHVLETLLHEMAHLKNAQEGISDCTATQYHNSEFKKSAEYFGLKVDKMKGRGWAFTSLSDKVITAIELLKPNKDAYQITRRPPLKLKKEPKTIPLSVDLSYQEKIDFLMGEFEGKRQMTEEAIDLLYKQYKK